MTWTETYDAVFFITLATLLTGSISLAFKYCLKSKCEHFICCYGLINIDRRVELETEIEERQEEKTDNNV